MNKIVTSLLPFALVATLLSGLMYATTQQVLRMNANDPQVQLAHDLADAAAIGQDPAVLLPATKVEISKSLAPFINIYDANGSTVAGTGLLNGSLPALPSGVLDAAKNAIDNRLTWQPQPGVRSAIVAVQYKNNDKTGFVVAGRSLKEAELRETQLGRLIVIGWLCSLALLAAAITLLTSRS